MQCNGITVIGTRCSKNTNNTFGYCGYHKHQSPIYKAKPTECPCCLESLETMQDPLSCGHWIHLECIQKSIDALHESYATHATHDSRVASCPICRKEIPFIKPCTQKSIEILVSCIYKIPINKIVNDNILYTLLNDLYTQNREEFISNIMIIINDYKNF